MTTLEEVTDLVESRRAQLLADARTTADRLIERDGETNVNELIAAMAEDGLINETTDLRFVGFVFRTSRYRWTGKVTKSVKNRFGRTGSNSDRLIMVWTHADRE